MALEDSMQTIFYVIALLAIFLLVALLFNVFAKYKGSKHEKNNREMLYWVPIIIFAICIGLLYMLQSMDFSESNLKLRLEI